ncbi:uncharacterized protein LOC125520500 [Triticum urartu]|uniref:uncharacterized protein LOC125520500 n=1 Tax=Triticum urartu TaxID=4572 RepID=UPI002043EE20|nr:uncharacterized protein LOC125520500 [Triticum urartu]
MGDLKAVYLGGVEGKLKNLQLSEAEKKGIKIGRKQACSSQVSKLQAVGKLISERPARAEHVGRTLGGVWSPLFGVECKDLGRNRFLFIFQQRADKEKALDAGPWRFNNDLLMMEDFMPSKTIDEYEFRTIPIWVRAYGIPMGMMSKETGDLIGEQIGKVIDVDPEICGDSMGAFMRIKVRIDITVPIMRFVTSFIDDEEEQEQENVMIPVGDDEEIELRRKKREMEEKIVSFTYEYLPDFCYSCGIIGHTEKSCPTRSRRTGSRQFGPWLRANIYMGSSSEERSRGSNDKGKFWPSNSAGNKGSGQGSDGPSWRRNVPSGDDEEGAGRNEGKEVTNPFTLKECEDQGAGERKRLDSNEKVVEEPSRKEQTLAIESSKAEEENNTTTKANRVSKGCGQTEINQQESNEITNQVETRTGMKMKELQKYANEGDILMEKKKGRTVKIMRQDRANKTQTQVNMATEAKKRGADDMEIDMEPVTEKKMKMEVEINATTDEGRTGEANTKAAEPKFDVKAGLANQSREAK